MKYRHLFIIAILFAMIFSLPQKAHAQSTLNRSDAYLQGFYWNSPPGGIWYDSLSALASRLSSAGFGAIWLPPPSKGAGGALSMGYDPYDHYDFGEYSQKGSRETRFGSRAELENAIKTFHKVGMEVYADVVTEHMMGGEQLCKRDCPSFSDSAWNLFQYPYGSGRFKKDSTFFYPNHFNCDTTAPFHGAADAAYQFGVWLDKDQTRIKDSLIVWGQYLKEVLGFDGFRLDAVKSVNPTFMGPFVKAANPTGYNVAEYYSGTDDIKYWQSQTATNGANVAMFDFPLRFALADMCNTTSGDYDMTGLDNAGLVNSGLSGYYVSTFVENHDLDRTGYDGTVDGTNLPIITNKEMAYAYIMFSEGRPCVFFKDYIDYGLSGKIDTLMYVRTKYLGGGTTKRSGLNVYYIRQDGNTDQTTLAKDVFVARRDGYNSQIGGYLVINDNASQWIDVWVDTKAAEGSVYKDFIGHDANKTVSSPSYVGGPNRVKLWCPPRSYTLYVLDTTSLNNPPALNPVPDQVAYSNTPLKYQTNGYDVDKQTITYKLSNNPSWMSISATGLISGTPAMADTGSSTVIVAVSDPAGLSVSDTFVVKVYKNYSPKLGAVKDTSAIATNRFEMTVTATDADKDSLAFGFAEAPSFLSVGTASGIIAGTPAITDTGLYFVHLFVIDYKGGYDSLTFKLTVKKTPDPIIKTFGKPVIDGTVHEGSPDWLADWKLAADSDTDGHWHHGDTLTNELYGIYSTWDADSLYIGVSYDINDLYNTLIVYIDAGIPGGIVNFNSVTSKYRGDYAKNNRFRSTDSIDFFIADYYKSAPTFFKTYSDTSVNITTKINGKRGLLGRDMEMAVAWNDIYGLGAGLIPPGVKLKMVAVIAGGLNYGSGDSCPDNPDVDGNAGPDSLINLVTITPDLDTNGLPDATVILNDVKSTRTVIPSAYALYQNYPNPFNPATKITFDLPQSGLVNLTVYDVLGRKVAVLLNDFTQAGTHSVRFNASNLSSGVYIYKITAGKFSDTKKLLLMK